MLMSWESDILFDNGIYLFNKTIMNYVYNRKLKEKRNS